VSENGELLRRISTQWFTGLVTGVRGAFRSLLRRIAAPEPSRS
jgi:hypothetical protein